MGEMINGCSSDNEYIQTILDNMKNRGYSSNDSLQYLINTYYNIYQSAYGNLEETKKTIMNYYKDGSGAVFKNMMISNPEKLEKDGKEIYKFELTSDYPISFRLPFILDPSEDSYSKLSYIGDKKNNISRLIIKALQYDGYLEKLEEALKAFIKINKNYVFELDDSLPFVICLDHHQVSICNANDGSNNPVSLVDIDLEKKTLSFNESIQDNEFTAIFKNSLPLILRNAFLKPYAIKDSFGYVEYSDFEIVEHLMIEYNLQEKEKKVEEVPERKELFFINIPNEGYQLIDNYNDAHYNQEGNFYVFDFHDYSKLFIPVSSLIIVNGSVRQAKTSDAYREIKRLSLEHKEKE